ncbi:MAG: hypothetical protein QOG47_2704, partial [Mycobacterium sp.]|nr:hypothetical protein [Mycobacterium sp.]
QQVLDLNELARSFQVGQDAGENDEVRLVTELDELIDILSE